MNLSSEEYELRKKIWEAIKTLTKSEHEELFRLLKRSQVEYIENTNGVFFDLTKVSQEVFDKISQFIQFCNENRLNFEKRDKEMEDLRQTV
jgi:hypothetical protein